MGFETSAGPGYQNQHLITFASRNTTVLKLLSENGLFDIDDDVFNRLRLPTSDVVARASGTALASEIVDSAEAVHQGSHPAYSRFVSRILDQLAFDYGLVDVNGRATGISLGDNALRAMADDVQRFQQAVGRGSPRRFCPPRSF